MALIGSLTSGVSAMRSFTKGLEVIGNNIANVNTIGFKSSSVNFADSFSNTLRSSAPSSASNSNQSAIQVGTGVQISQINTSFTQGALSSTGLNTDLGISGNGFFMVKNPNGGAVYATRAGNFRIDDNGYLVTDQGYRVQGATGGTTTAAPAGFGDIRLKTATDIAADWVVSNAANIHSTAAVASGDAAAVTAIGGWVTAAGSATNPATLLTSLASDVTTANTAVTTAQSAYTATPTQANLDTLNAATATATLLQNTYNAASAAQGSGTNAQMVANILGSLNSSATTAAATASKAATAATAAATPPKLSSFSIGNAGEITEFYSDGSSQTTNQLLLQNYSDTTALVKEGGNLYSGFDAAGIIGPSTPATATNAPGGNGLGSIKSGTLELSNVDLTNEFANMITTQRSFQASSRLITVSDSVLDDIVNLKRS
jgi:flagellar hook protein FlgE